MYSRYEFNLYGFNVHLCVFGVCGRLCVVLCWIQSERFARQCRNEPPPEIPVICPSRA